jgi:hypothetical protein
MTSRKQGDPWSPLIVTKTLITRPILTPTQSRSQVATNPFVFKSLRKIEDHLNNLIAQHLDNLNPPFTFPLRFNNPEFLFVVPVSEWPPLSSAQTGS